MTAFPDGMAQNDHRLYVVEIHDDCQPQLAGHAGCRYASSPQPALEALTLVRVVLGFPRAQLDVDEGPWRCAIAGGSRTVRMHRAG